MDFEIVASTLKTIGYVVVFQWITGYIVVYPPDN